MKVIVISPDIFGMNLKIPMPENLDGLRKWVIKHKAMLQKTRLISVYTLSQFEIAFNADEISDQGLICIVTQEFFNNHFHEYR